MNSARNSLSLSPPEAYCRQTDIQWVTDHSIVESFDISATL